MIKGKGPNEVVDAINERKDLSAFHTSLSVALLTAVQ